MDKETLSNYGWIVICVLVIAVMVALATPFGNYVKSAVENTTQGLYDTSAGAINSTGLMHIAGQSFEGSAGGSGSAYNHDDPALHPTDGVWEGSRTTPQNGDTYETTDYTYTFSSYSNGWKVSVKDKSKTSYEPILERINGVPVTSMDSTFDGCFSLTIAPIIPQNVIYMGAAFSETAIVTAPEIPNGVIDVGYAFFDCTNLTTAPTIPDSVTNMSWTFAFCTSLTTAPRIPSNVMWMEDTFDGCVSLTGSIEINANPTGYEYCLQGTQITAVVGDTTLKAELLATKNG